MELQLDWQKQKGGVRRALFLASRQAALTQTLLIENGAREDCREMKIYLRVWPERGLWADLGRVATQNWGPLLMERDWEIPGKDLGLWGNFCRRSWEPGCQGL